MEDISWKQYLRQGKLPHLWCSGCSHGIILGAVIRAMAFLNLDCTKTVVVTGIGCFGKADDYLNTHTLHGTQGRALAFASGIKAVKPELTVIALMGDGDCASIGGNHLIHSARRNMDITAIVANNYNYGMTGGQYSATTPIGNKTTTSYYGSPEPNFDLCNLAIGAGASFVARGTPYYFKQLVNFITEAIQNKGFSFIEVLGICPTHFGRYNLKADPVYLMSWLRDHTMHISHYNKLKEAERGNYVPIGKLSKKNMADFNQNYIHIQNIAQGEV